MRAGFDRVDERFEAMYRLLVKFAAGLVVAVVGLYAALLGLFATQL